MCQGVWCALSKRLEPMANAKPYRKPAIRQLASQATDQIQPASQQPTSHATNLPIKTPAMAAISPPTKPPPSQQTGRAAQPAKQRTRQPNTTPPTSRLSHPAAAQPVTHSTPRKPPTANQRTTADQPTGAGHPLSTTRAANNPPTNDSNQRRHTQLANARARRINKSSRRRANAERLTSSERANKCVPRTSRKTNNIYAVFENCVRR